MTIRPTTLDMPTRAPSDASFGSSPMGKTTVLVWAVVAVVIALLGSLYAESLRFLGQSWLEDDNYSHGPFIPLISLYLMWIRWPQVQTVERRGRWWGPPVILGGLFIFVVGQFAAMHAVVHLSLWMVLAGFVIGLVGTSGLSLLAFPFGYLLAAVPLPAFLHGELSGRLQLWSSALGIGCLQLVGVMAYREGNVIDLGPIQLQVVEACSGLRYLFPLTALTLLCAYLYQEARWKRVLLVLSCIPISILLNGFRIGSIGLLVDTYGPSAAEGFSHFFEGWVFFVASLGLLCVEMWVLARVGRTASRRPFAELIGLPPVPASIPRASVCSTELRGQAPLFAGGLMLILALIAAPGGAPEEFPVPERQSLLDFPLQLGEWHGLPSAMERQYLEALQLDDYVLADYSTAEKVPVNVYVAYYGSPKKGRSSHSPRQCIPGGGWDITSFEPLRLDRSAGLTPALDVNRVVIEKGGHKQVVYYWFKQRDRWMTSEYFVKFFLFWDALTRQRADGALVRLVSAVHPGETETMADERLQTMAGLLSPLLSRYVPD